MTNLNSMMMIMRITLIMKRWKTI